jgi:hypothetical protein
MMVTGSGSWSPLVFLLAMAAVSLAVLLIRHLGEKGYRKEREKALPFFSGDVSMAENRITEIYWGFSESLGRYYRWMKRAHNGIVNDYVYWFVLALVVIISVVVFL